MSGDYGLYALRRALATLRVKGSEIKNFKDFQKDKYSIKNLREVCEILYNDEILLSENGRKWVTEEGVRKLAKSLGYKVRFIRERFAINEYKDLKKIIEKTTAITILNYAKVSFNNEDLRGINIKGADLRGAMLDCTDLRETNLKNVIFDDSTLLKNADLRKSNMQGLKFEKKKNHKTHKTYYTSISYSKDGTLLVLVTREGEVIIYDRNTKSKKETITLKNIKSIKNISFTKDKRYIAIGYAKRKIPKKEKSYKNIPIMVWSSISWFGKTEIVIVKNFYKNSKCKMNSQVYTSVLEQSLVPFIDKNHNNQEFEFLQDNAPIDKSKYTINWFKNNNINLTDFPPQSPDLNPIEKIWKELKDLVE
ncbi:hypothetical protein M0812_08938 [Anaeramoeba flamelloides]|uniref:Tc1-like transposase DDE domain-containing protein n=1 Tax=Anaeramoeba flamelloides TaxID=1746091 RepID=A0AAV7ZR27_9EUKA|nr:hypothetical protein M0812_08938 [Anaeramoeba flamelloides]